MLDSSTYVGGLPIGAIVSGQFGGKAQFLPCDGREVLKSAYPAMSDFTDMTAFGSNVLTTHTSMPSATQWCAIAFGAGVHVAVSRTSGTVAASSANGGVTWTSRTIPVGVYYDVKWVSALSLFVAVGASVCATSPDGITWTSRTLAISAGSITYGAGLLVAGPAGAMIAASSNSNSYATSPDGVTWTSRTLPASLTYAAIRWCDDRFIAPTFSAAGAAHITSYSSVDGLSWVGFSGPLSVNTYAVESFKGRLFWSTAGQLYVSQQEAAYVSAGSPLTAGWSHAGTTFYTGIAAQGVCKAGEWLFNLESQGNLLATLDGQIWRSLGVFGTLTLGAGNALSNGMAAYGNNSLVILTGTSASTTCYTLAADTTKFRVPKVRTYSEIDRPYMKVA